MHWIQWLGFALILSAGAREPTLDDEYADMVEKRHALRSNLDDPRPRFDPWKYFREAWPCPTTRRYGTLGDGGKWMCFVPPRCIVLSLGINNEFSFETELVQTHNCTVYGYDPTIYQTPELKRWVRFRKTGVRGDDGSGMSIREMLNQNNLTRVDVLKVDVEGAEFGMLDELYRDYPLNNASLPFDQLLIEFHLPPISRHSIRDLIRTVEQLEQYGFRIFETELNPDNPHCCAELAFVHKDAHAREFRVWYLIDQAVHRHDGQ